MNKIAVFLIALVVMTTCGLEISDGDSTGRQSIPPINEECRLRCVENVAQTINSNEITELGYDLASFIGGVCTSYCYGERLSYPPLYEKAKRRSKFLVSSK